MDDAALALACAIMLNPDLAQTAQQNGGIPLPQINRIDDWSYNKGQQVDSRGNVVDTGRARGPKRTNTRTGARMPHEQGAAAYTWRPGGMLTLTPRAGAEQQAHEMTHHLQNLSGVDPGRNANSDARRSVERQAYTTERKSRFECMGTFSGKWDEQKLAPYLKGITGNGRRHD